MHCARKLSQGDCHGNNNTKYLNNPLSTLPPWQHTLLTWSVVCYGFHVWMQIIRYMSVKRRIAFLDRACCSECLDERYTKNIFLFFHWDETSYLFLFLAAFFPISFSFFWPQSFNFFPYNQVSMKSYLPSRADCLVLMMRRFFFQSLVNHKCFFNLLLFFVCSPQSLQLWMVALDDRIRSLFVMCFQVGDGITTHK